MTIGSDEKSATKIRPPSLVVIFYLENQRQAQKLLEFIEKFNDLAKYQDQHPK